MCIRDRDIIDASLELDGVPLVVVDTAGLRNRPSGKIEEEGIRRTRIAVEESEIILFVMDGSISQTDLELLEDPRTIYILNKSDLGIQPENRRLLANKEYIELSALTGENLELLIDAIKERIGAIVQDVSLIGNIRQQEVIAGILGNINRALQQIESYPELAAEELKEGIDSICQLTFAPSPDVIDNIFKNFCIGK